MNTSIRGPEPDRPVSDSRVLDEPDVVVADPSRRRLILAAMCVALVAVVASVSGLNVAQQALAIDLGASQSQLLWAINGYTLALAALLMPVGAVGDRWGRKPILMAGLVVFIVANVSSAFAGKAGPRGADIADAARSAFVDGMRPALSLLRRSRSSLPC